MKPVIPAASTVAVTANVDGTIVSELQVALADAQALVIQQKDAMAAAEQRYIDMEARLAAVIAQSVTTGMEVTAALATPAATVTSGANSDMSPAAKTSGGDEGKGKSKGSKGAHGHY